MRNSIFIIIFILLFTTACTKQNSKYVNMSDMHVYMSDTGNESNLLAFDAIPNDDGGVVVFCVGGNIDSKYRAIGNLVILKIDKQGEMETHKKIEEITEGFPADIISNNDGFHVFWNDSSGAFKRILINKTTLETIELATLTINSNFNINYITTAVEFNNMFLLQGIGNDELNDNVHKKSFIAQSTDDNNTYKTISANDYLPSVFGGYGNEDIAMLQGLTNCFKVFSNQNRIYYSTPFKDKMVIKEIGDPASIYTDSDNWITAFATNDDNTFSAVFNDRKESKIAYYPMLDFKSEYSGFLLPDDDFNYIEIKNVDTDQAINIVDGIKDMIVVTNNSGQLSIHTYDGIELIEKTIGRNYPYRPINAHIQGDELILIGNTDVEYQYKRVFLMKIPLSELE